MQPSSPHPSVLVLEDGSVFHGVQFGANVEAIGEVVFTTGMTGYQETLTDPSFQGQIVVLTYPLIGNYGINPDDVESRELQLSALVVHELCQEPSNWRSTRTLDKHLRASRIPGISGVDTRSLTRHIRRLGSMMGAVSSTRSAQELLATLKVNPNYSAIDFVKVVSCREPYVWEESRGKPHRVALLDFGVKYNLLRVLARAGCEVTVYPCDTTADDILAARPEGVVLSPGPGNPALLEYAIETTRRLIRQKPVLGVCLGHQLIGLALGSSTFKLKFGHRGANHPVLERGTGVVRVTSQNHGFALSEEGLPAAGAHVSHVNLNDNTVEGLRHLELPLLSIQFHPEASPGPNDSTDIVAQFVALLPHGLPQTIAANSALSTQHSALLP
ncbi:MAG: glutamine-hydrolyzing carbamoyl-phosphate synthase small subunit [Chloroflexota bacterium]|nr:glutamine-hydrolyzing carbamoyl-phosphate synthase small subunit [Chloroflexota bacterium]